MIVYIRHEFDHYVYYLDTYTITQMRSVNNSRDMPFCCSAGKRRQGVRLCGNRGTGLECRITLPCFRIPDDFIDADEDFQYF